MSHWEVSWKISTTVTLSPSRDTTVGMPRDEAGRGKMVEYSRHAKACKRIHSPCRRAPDNVTDLALVSPEGSPGKFQQPATRETKLNDDRLGPRDGYPTIWTTTPNPNNPLLQNALTSAHRGTPSLSDTRTPSHRSQTVRPDAKLRLSLPAPSYPQPGSPRVQLPGIYPGTYAHNHPPQCSNPTTSNPRSDASQHHRGTPWRDMISTVDVTFLSYRRKGAPFALFQKDIVPLLCTCRIQV
ncbi:hypothetical protein B0T18DRAFT_162220 [Schizothecium vesticola]|uniref:Uncharacterized protein n=1 Tax=Schizothecium vesticola TaxID=314040 RepID=A0AA40EWV7_9PEZI|nr:hypothetical protein B0T18DRAFT_162220 [Schizothecium vesticola]